MIPIRKMPLFAVAENGDKKYKEIYMLIATSESYYYLWVISSTIESRIIRSTYNSYVELIGLDARLFIRTLFSMDITSKNKEFLQKIGQDDRGI